MRILLDTNIIISSIIFPSKIMDKFFENVVLNHTMVISSYSIDEFHKVIEKKFPDRMPVAERLLERMNYELVYTPKSFDPEFMVKIRDEKDLPIIYTAIKEDIDVLVTGDRDFGGLGLEHPEILTVREFLDKYSADI